MCGFIVGVYLYVQHQTAVNLINHSQTFALGCNTMMLHCVVSHTLYAPPFTVQCAHTYPSVMFDATATQRNFVIISQCTLLVVDNRQNHHHPSAFEVFAICARRNPIIRLYQNFGIAYDKREVLATNTASEYIPIDNVFSKPY